MQGDLISRKDLIKELELYEEELRNDRELAIETDDEMMLFAIMNQETAICRIRRNVLHMPVAYNVEDVIEQTHKIFVDELEIIEKGIPEGGEYTEEAYRLLYLNKCVSDAVRNGGKE